MTIESQSGWLLNEDIKMSHPVSLGQLRSIISPFWTCITETKTKTKTKTKYETLNMKTKTKTRLRLTFVTFALAAEGRRPCWRAP